MSTFDDIKKGKEDDEEDSDDALLWQIVSSKRSARGKKHLRNVQLAKTKFRLGEDEDEDKEEDEDDDFETLVKDTERKLERAKRDVKESIFSSVSCAGCSSTTKTKTKTKTTRRNNHEGGF